MAVRLYHLARDMNLRGSELLTLLRDRGLEVPSVMTILEDEESAHARRVASGEIEIRKPEPGEPTEITLPPPVVPAPARPLRPTPPAARPATKRSPAQRPAQAPRRGIKIFRQKEARERKMADRAKAEEIFTGRTIPIPVPISLKDFSQQIGVKTNQLLLHLMKQGIMANPNTTLDEETVLVLGEAFNRTIEIQSERGVEEELQDLIATRESEVSGETRTRPPVVAVLGHVDHGKTSLLDHIRETRVAAGEAGGITQHIGAYSVKLPGGQTLTFLDTPGHEAFTAMRARGAKLTDIVVLVVAADDGVMPQTVEAINHARAAEVPIVVAVNKCDKPDAQPDRARQQLASANLIPEEWGGDIAMLNVSAKTGDGIPELLQRIALEAEVLDRSSTPDKPAEGYVVEASKQTGKGVVATLLVKDGTLHRGDMVLCGSSQGKVKSMTDDRGRRVQKAPPSSAVEVTGLDEVPEAGWRFQVVRDKELARKVAMERSQRQREKVLASKTGSSFEKLLDRITSDVRELRIVLKGDVKGSIEALRAKLTDLTTDEVKVKILHAAVGGVTESDVLLAEASGAIVLGFQVVADGKARAAAEHAAVQIRTYQVIYELLDDVRSLMEGLLPKEMEEVVTGHAEIRQVFMFRKSRIAGCMVTDGVVRRACKLRLTRDGRVILNDAEIDSLRRFKDDAKEVREGFDCGIKIAGYEDIKEGDLLEFYEIEERQRTL